MTIQLGNSPIEEAIGGHLKYIQNLALLLVLYADKEALEMLNASNESGGNKKNKKKKKKVVEINEICHNLDHSILNIVKGSEINISTERSWAA